jgi:putative CocE/NonD family hydrolase
LPLPARSRTLALVLATALAAIVVALAVPATRHAITGALPKDRVVQLNGLRFGYGVERDLRIPMPDGVALAASLYLPRHRDGPLATVLVRLPYGRLDYGEALNAAERFARLGYAVLLVDLRGTHDSGGEFEPYAHGESDGAATLDWIVAQPWSNRRVGTFGCSALGETQYVLARARHPALRAMLPLGAGGAIGAAAGRYSYFGLYEGGIFELASGFGWFVQYGTKRPDAPPLQPFDVGAALRELPVAGLVQRHRPAPNGYEAFVARPLADPSWHALGYLDDTDAPAVPTFEITTWGDQTVGDTLAWHAALAARDAAAPASAPVRHLVIAPGTHCHAEEAGESAAFGDLEVHGADAPWWDWYARWFDRWLRDRGDGLAALPPVLYYMLGEQRWHAAPSWPPPQARGERWYLDGGGHANGAAGDGTLAPAPPAAAAVDAFKFDPLAPVPSRGGPVCCTGNPADRAGPVDQRDIEARADVLVYTSPVLQAPMRIAGPLRATLQVESSAPDTDFVARLVDVAPDGRAIGIQEGALRARWREGFERPRPLVPGAPATLVVDMRAIAYQFAAGHRLRLDITSSSFPRLERNLGTGGDNALGTHGQRARNRVLHGGERLSWIDLPVLPASAAEASVVRAATGPAGTD